MAEVVWISSVACSSLTTGADEKRRLGSLQGKGCIAAPAAPLDWLGGRGTLAAGKGRGAQPLDRANAALQIETLECIQLHLLFALLNYGL